MNPLVERVLGPMLTVHQWLYEHSDGRIGATLGGRPMLLLRTVGRRTGQPRPAALLYVRDGDAYVVIASNGGAPAHPDWYRNLVDHPDAEVIVAGVTTVVRAETVSGAERERLWQNALHSYGGYAGYQARTTREIPVVRLVPVASPKRS